MEPVTMMLLTNWLLNLAKGASVLGLFFGVFRVIGWIKTKFSSIDSNVIELKKSLDSNIGGLREDLKHQTTTLAAALSEQRADFRTFCAPSLLVAQHLATTQIPLAAPVRAKRSVRRKAPAKPKAKK